MKETSIGFAASVAAHACIIALFLGLSMGAGKPAKSIVVDFSLLDPRAVGTGGARGTGVAHKVVNDRQGSGGGSGKPRAAEASGRPAPPQAATPAETSHIPASSTGGPAILSDPSGDVSVYGAAVSGASGEGSGRGVSTGTREGSGGGQDTGGRGSSAGMGDSPLGGKDFYYIRDTVMRNIKYPEKARRMGLEGRVLVSFVVLENGSTGDINVVNSSGSRLLDESATDGVARTTIHKKVPYRVVVMLPVVYRLHHSAALD
jgi:periplasmic protein TonB